MIDEAVLGLLAAQIAATLVVYHKLGILEEAVKNIERRCYSDVRCENKRS